jgi:hypothetical protein
MIVVVHEYRLASCAVIVRCQEHVAFVTCDKNGQGDSLSRSGRRQFESTIIFTCQVTSLKSHWIT